MTEQDRRTELHEILCGILGSRNVYFQPPESVKMSYPAIVYGLDGIDNTFADNRNYLARGIYSITVIDKNPDSIIRGRVNSLLRCRFNHHYQKDNLNHDVFTSYY